MAIDYSGIKKQEKALFFCVFSYKKQENNINKRFHIINQNNRGTFFLNADKLFLLSVHGIKDFHENF